MGTMIRKRFSLLVLAGLFLPVGASLHALVLTGSDLLSKDVRDAILTRLEAAGVDAVISFDGSLQGLRNLESGLVDASILALPETSDLQTSLRRFPLCYQIVACAVHQTNPLYEISYNDLVSLYEEKGLTDSWSSLVRDPSWANRKISLMAARRQNSIALELFNAKVLKGQRLKPAVRYVSGSDEALLASVVTDPAALVIMPAVELSGPVKYLAVKQTAEDQAYTPSIDNVFFGDYPLRLPFYLVVSDEMNEAAIGTLLEALYSETVTGAFESLNFLPVPEPEQRALLSRFR